jgi:hypothetical protein
MLASSRCWCCSYAVDKLAPVSGSTQLFLSWQVPNLPPMRHDNGTMLEALFRFVARWIEKD